MCLCKAGGLAFVEGKITSMYQPTRYSYDVHSIPLQHLPSVKIAFIDHVVYAVW